MIGKEENQEDVSFKVADRRKFNSDGSVKEGVTLDAAPARETPPAPQRGEPQTPPAIKQGAPAGSDAFDDLGDMELADQEDLGTDDEGMPGAEDPASFVNFLSTLATNAAAALGAVPHPATGKRSLDLDSGKYWLDVLGMIKDKTKGNLHSQESRILDVLLSDLRMQYVQMVRATEEKLKAQAAQKFSGADILGKK
jgi:hypothetical protein